MERLLYGMARRYLWRFVGKGIDVGAEHLARRGNGGAEPADLTPEQRAQAARNSRNAKQALRMMRRMGRFTR